MLFWIQQKNSFGIKYLVASYKCLKFKYKYKLVQVQSVTSLLIF